MDVPPPVRCFTCKKVITQGTWDRYWGMLRNGVQAEEALNAIAYPKYCCRRTFVGWPPCTGALTPELPMHGLPYSFRTHDLSSAGAPQSVRWIRAE